MIRTEEPLQDKNTLNTKPANKQTLRTENLLFKSRQSQKQPYMKCQGSATQEKSEVFDVDNQNLSAYPKRSDRSETEMSYNPNKRASSIPNRANKNDDLNKSIGNTKLNESTVTINELKRMLDAGDKGKGNKYNKYGDRKFLMENCNEELTQSQIREEDREHVRNLDRWRLEIKRKKILNSMDKMSEILDMYTKKKVKEPMNIPLVNADALNRIMDESDDDKSQSNRSMSVPTNKKERGIHGVEKVNYVQGPMVENNYDLVTSLIMKKVNEQISLNDVKELRRQQLALKVRAIAESVIFKFKALKKHGSESLIQNQVSQIVKKLKAKLAQEENSKNIQSQNPEAGKLNTEEESVVDYRMVEVALTKNFEQSIEEINNLNARINELNNETFNLKKNLIQCQEQLRQLGKKQKVVVEENNESKLTLSPIKDDGQGSPVEGSDLSADYMKEKKSKYERKKQEAMLKEKIVEIQERLGPVFREAESAEKDLKLARDSKTYYRLQLKDLYYQLLKDEKYLLKNRSEASYTWIVKALWKINEEIKDQAFPTFMDYNNIYFFKEYSKKQSELEKYCKQNNLMGVLSGFDDFKQIYSNAFNQVQAQPKQKNEPEIQIINEAEQGVSASASTKVKSMEGLIKEFQDKMSSMKKSHIKAKRLVNVVQYNTRGRFYAPKWEDVDPLTTSEQLLNSERTKMTERDSASQEKLKINKPEFVPPVLSSSPTGIATKMLLDLEGLKKREINRVIKENIGTALDERLTSILEKLFLFMFGREDGTDAFRRFMKEKRIFDDRNMKNSPTNKKSQSQGPQSSRALFSLPNLGNERDQEEITTDISRKVISSSQLPRLNMNSSTSTLKFKAPPLLYDKANIIVHVGGSQSSRLFAKKGSVS